MWLVWLWAAVSCGLIAFRLAVLLCSRTFIGYSFLTNERGLASDNIAALELALPNGEVVTINETSNQDLFHAIKVSALHCLAL